MKRNKYNKLLHISNNKYSYSKFIIKLKLMKNIGGF